MFKKIMKIVAWAIVAVVLLYTIALAAGLMGLGLRQSAARGALPSAPVCTWMEHVGVL